MVRFADGGQVAAHTVVLATGVDYRTLDVPGADRLTGLGVFYGSAATEAAACAGEDVYVVGGANAAGQAAMFLSRHARRVTLLVRADGLEESMSYYLIRQIHDAPNIEVRPRTQVVGAAGHEHLERLGLCDTRAGTVEEVPASFLFVFIGASPCTQWLDGVIARDPNGFLLTGPDLLVGGKRPSGWPLDRDPYYLEGSVPGVFAAGDVRANSVKRVASAVGEGAMAIQLVHRYLEAQ
jgi:thioredoxin reductase (NADPH)